MKGRRRAVLERRRSAEGRPRALPPGFPSMVALAGLLILGTVWVLWPRVTIVVSPRVVAARQKAVIRASTLVGEADIESGEVPAQVVEGTLEASVTVPTSGSCSTGVTRARGSVLFINEGSGPVAVPAGAALETPGKTRFVTLAAVVVPASRMKSFMNQAVGMEAGMAEVGVEACEPGTTGNVAAGRISVIADRRLSRLKVTNPEPLGGGEDKISPVVAEADFEVARKRLEAEAFKAASRALFDRATGDRFVLAETLIVEEIDPVYSHGPFSHSSELRASCRVDARALAVSRADISKVASGQFMLALEGGDRVTSREVGVEIVQVKRADEASAVIEATACATIARDIEPVLLSRALAGASAGEAKAILAAAPGVKSFSIGADGAEPETLPRFWRWIRVMVEPCEE